MRVHTGETIFIRRQVIIKFWPVASLVLIVFILVSFFISKDYVTGWLHLANLVFLSVSLFISLKLKKVLLACNILAAVGMITILTFLFTGGPAHAGFWWSIVYVVGVFLVTTKRWAVFWLALYVALSFIIVLLSLQGFVTIVYTVAELLHLLFVFAVTFCFVYYFNQVCDYYLELANKRAEELSHLNQELTAANKELEEFAYVASHDLQEPLQTISNFTGLLEARYTGTPDEEARQYFSFISSASAKMKQLITDLLDLSRVGRNTVFAPVDCNGMLNEVVAQMHASITQSRAVIVAPNLPLVQGNETQLKRLFQNLISNAIKFKKEGRDPRLEITAEEKENQYLFSFKDNGIGIEEQHKNRIFVIFQRLHTADEYAGTGIGLAVCKKIVAGHHGKIWVESQPGNGSIFYFTLTK